MGGMQHFQFMITFAPRPHVQFFNLILFSALQSYLLISDQTSHPKRLWI